MFHDDANGGAGHRSSSRRTHLPRNAGRLALACTSEGCDGPGLAARLHLRLRRRRRHRRTGYWVGTMSLTGLDPRLFPDT